MANRNDFLEIGMNKGPGQYLLVIFNHPVAFLFNQTLLREYGLGGIRTGSIRSQNNMSI